MTVFGVMVIFWIDRGAHWSVLVLGRTRVPVDLDSGGWHLVANRHFNAYG